MSFKLPAFLIKKIFPPKKVAATVDTTGDGKADALRIKALNMIQPFTIPETVELGDFDINDFDLSDYGEILLDDEPLDISKDNVNMNFVRDNITIYHKGDAYTIEDILAGKAGGKTIAMGDALTIILKLEDQYLAELTEGKHTVTIDVESIPTITVGFQLNKKNMNIPFDPSDT